MSPRTRLPRREIFGETWASTRQFEHFETVATRALESSKVSDAIFYRPAIARCNHVREQVVAGEPVSDEDLVYAVASALSTWNIIHLTVSKVIETTGVPVIASMLRDAMQVPVPDGHRTSTIMEPRQVATMSDACRPNHGRGGAAVVVRLLHVATGGMVMPVDKQAMQVFSDDKPLPTWDAWWDAYSIYATACITRHQAHFTSTTALSRAFDVPVSRVFDAYVRGRSQHWGTVETDKRGTFTLAGRCYSLGEDMRYEIVSVYLSRDLQSVVVTDGGRLVAMIPAGAGEPVSCRDKISASTQARGDGP